MTARAAAATLQAADFPAGFNAKPNEPGAGLGLEPLWVELARCLGVDNTRQRSGIATSPTFLQGLATQARATVEYTSDLSATAIADAIEGPNFEGCAVQAFQADVKRTAPQGGIPGPVTVSRSVASPTASRSAAFRITVTINLDELAVPLFQDFLVAVERGAVIRLLFLKPGSEFPQDLERSLVQKVISRV